MTGYDPYLLTASVLLIALALAHSILGEIRILRKMNGESLPAMRGIPMLWNIENPAARTIRFVWHITSVLGISHGALLAYLSGQEKDLFIIGIVSCALFASGLIALLFTRGSHLGWIAFIAAGALCILSVI
ncbi:MAG: hypothetical protein AB1458_10620 [Bacteroidota bacterium]